MPFTESSPDREETQRRREEERQAKLREMAENARALEDERTSYISKVNAEEADQERREAELRQKLIDARERGHADGKGTFLLEQQRKTFSDHLDLAERIKRSRGGYQRFD
jgi:ferritin